MQSCEYLVPPLLSKHIRIFNLTVSSFLRLEYVRVNNTKHELPTNIMPKFKFLEDDGRADLKRGEVVIEVVKHSYAYMIICSHIICSYHMLKAISKFGGKKNISHKAGLTVT